MTKAQTHQIIVNVNDMWETPQLLLDEKLKELTIQQREQNSTADILSAGLAIFGIILGAAVVGAVIDEFTGGE